VKSSIDLSPILQELALFRDIVVPPADFESPADNPSETVPKKCSALLVCLDEIS
jgi:hypothetical protein